MSSFEIVESTAPDGAPTVDWNAVPLRAVVNHLEVHYHRSIERELPRLRGILRKVAVVHGALHGERFAALEETVDALRDEVEPHLKKEADILFPWIRSGRGETASAVVKVLAEEHASVAALLGEMRAITDGYVAPEEACSTWRSLWEGLHALERDLLAHIRLEDDVLFPRALA